MESQLHSQHSDLGEWLRANRQTFSFCFEGEPFRELAGVAGKTC